MSIFFLDNDSDDTIPPTVVAPTSTPTSTPTTPDVTDDPNDNIDPNQMTYDLFNSTISNVVYLLDWLNLLHEPEEFIDFGMSDITHLHNDDISVVSAFMGENVLGFEGWSIGTLLRDSDDRFNFASTEFEISSDFTTENVIDAYNFMSYLIFGERDIGIIWVDDPEQFYEVDFDIITASALFADNKSFTIYNWNIIDGWGYTIYVSHSDSSVYISLSSYYDNYYGPNGDYDHPEAWGMMNGIHNAFWMTLQEMVDHGYLLNPQHVRNGTWDWQYKGVNYYQLNPDIGYHDTYIGYQLYDEPSGVYPLVMYFGLNDLFGISFMSYDEVLHTFGAENLWWGYSEYYGMSILYGETYNPYLYARFVEIGEDEFTAVYFSFYPHDFWE
ncbi:MAG: hypothetical protein LBC73_08450 [Oscillospiraceae bacterium]|nr:hypothetical protein [Oscillospiraceae bacterium]